MKKENFHFTMKKSDLLQPFSLSNWVSIARVEVCFPRNLVAASSNCPQLRNTLCLCLPLQPAQAVPENCPKSTAIDFVARTSIYFWNSLAEWLPVDKCLLKALLQDIFHYYRTVSKHLDVLIWISIWFVGSKSPTVIKNTFREGNK